ncbi:type VI secretion system baseplate subunit TssE [Arhodomonas sp. SL1]|uniref:type VI secretion system baseplate subunit TssE n=1 Tax=Arhodomonas sp. SL1 TaxID=3425691 RepID=UPI003F884106
MAELTTQERLQPSLIDRLTDRAPHKERVTLRLQEQALAAIGMPARELRRLIEAQGFSRQREAAEDEGPVEVYESTPDGRSLRQLLDHTFRSQPNMPETAVGDLVEVTDRRRLPNTSESRRDRVMSGKQLKDSVMRDLGWLLNTGNLHSVQSLEAYPKVRDSVVNYGIPELAGVTASSADAESVAGAIARAIETFEPRLRHIRVVPSGAAREGASNTLAFLIEAELWGQPSSEHLLLHTELDLESAAARVREAEGGA